MLCTWQGCCACHENPHVTLCASVPDFQSMRSSIAKVSCLARNLCQSLQKCCICRKIYTSGCQSVAPVTTSEDQANKLLRLPHKPMWRNARARIYMGPGLQIVALFSQLFSAHAPTNVAFIFRQYPLRRITFRWCPELRSSFSTSFDRLSDSRFC